MAIDIAQFQQMMYEGLGSLTRDSFPKATAEENKIAIERAFSYGIANNLSEQELYQAVSRSVVSAPGQASFGPNDYVFWHTTIIGTEPKEIKRLTPFVSISDDANESNSILFDGKLFKSPNGEWVMWAAQGANGLYENTSIPFRIEMLERLKQTIITQTSSPKWVKWLNADNSETKNFIAVIDEWIGKLSNKYNSIMQALSDNIAAINSLPQQSDQRKMALFQLYERFPDKFALDILGGNADADLSTDRLIGAYLDFARGEDQRFVNLTNAALGTSFTTNDLERILTEAGFYERQVIVDEFAPELRETFEQSVEQNAAKPVIDVIIPAPTINTVETVESPDGDIAVIVPGGGLANIDTPSIDLFPNETSLLPPTYEPEPLPGPTITPEDAAAAGLIDVRPLGFKTDDELSRMTTQQKVEHYITLREMGYSDEEIIGNYNINANDWDELMKAFAAYTQPTIVQPTQGNAGLLIAAAIAALTLLG